jgi:hypothetical protein
MSKRSALTLATVFSLIWISEAFGQQCKFVHYDPGETRQLEVRQAPVMNWPVTTVQGVLKIKLLYWPDLPAGWNYVETIPTTTGGGETIKGWIPASRVGGDTSCRRAYR